MNIQALESNHCSLQIPSAEGEFSHSKLDALARATSALYCEASLVFVWVRRPELRGLHLCSTRAACHLCCGLVCQRIAAFVKHKLQRRPAKKPRLHSHSTLYSVVIVASQLLSPSSDIVAPPGSNMQDATTLYPPITPAWANLAAISEMNKLDLPMMSADSHRSDSVSPQSDRLVIDDDRLSPVSNASTSSSSSSTLPPKKRYMQMMHDNDSNKENDNLDFQILNTAGKVIKHRCRRCSFVTTTRSQYWSHLRTHIRPGKLLECPKCEFVTDCKHHLEYHLRKHVNSKPYKCQKCDYSCASKSMLDSHLKSHSTRRPYRCRECKFASKFCHGLRQHLDREGHEEGFMLNEDGSMNLTSVIVSTRREAEARGGRISTNPVQINMGNGKMIAVVLPTAAFYYDTSYAMPSATVQVVPQVHATAGYSQRSPVLPPSRQVEAPTLIDLTDETSMPLDLSKKSEAKESPVNLGYADEDNQENVREQIQHLRANLDNMHQVLWNFEQNYFYASA